MVLVPLSLHPFFLSFLFFLEDDRSINHESSAVTLVPRATSSLLPCAVLGSVTSTTQSNHVIRGASLLWDEFVVCSARIFMGLPLIAQIQNVLNLLLAMHSKQVGPMCRDCRHFHHACYMILARIGETQMPRRNAATVLSFPGWF